MKLIVLALFVAFAAAQNGYEAPPPPPEPTTAAPCDPVDESIPAECLETDADTGCQVAIEGCPEPTTVAPEEPVEGGEGQEGYEEGKMPEGGEEAPAEEGGEEPVEEGGEEPAEETGEAPAEEGGEEPAEEGGEEPAEEGGEEPAEEGGEEPTGETGTGTDTETGTGEEQPEGPPAEEGGEEPAEEGGEEPAEEGGEEPAEEGGEEPAEEGGEEPAEETGEAPVEEGGEQEQSSVDTDELPEEGMDIHEYCCWWAQEGECDGNPFWMRPRCQKSCGTAGCTVDGAGDCAVAVDTADCQWQKAELEGATGEAGPKAEVGKVPAEWTAPEGDCVNSHRLCNFWGAQGECDSNGDWMNANCKKACGQC